MAHGEPRGNPRLSRRNLLGAGFGAGLALTGSRARADAALDPTQAALRTPLLELDAFARRERAQVTASVIEVETGRELGALAPQQPLNPASNQKILIIAAALAELGPAYRFTTSVAGRLSAGAAPELVLRGNGDPELTTADLASLADELAARGLRRVDGDLLVDQSSFDALWDPPGYAQRPNEWAAYRAPVSAVAVDRNTVTLKLVAEVEGSAARVWFEPPGLVEVNGSVRSGAKGSAQNVRLSVRPRGERLEAQLGGSAPVAARTLAFSRRIAAPETAPGHALRALLERRSIVVSGAVRAAAKDGLDELATRRSRPLAQLLPALGKQSDNFSAEMLLKAIGRAASGVGSSAAGAAVIEARLRQLNVFDAGTVLGNGSGLYDANRVSARALSRLLAAGKADPRLGPELVASLAIGGVDGTLSQRFAGFARQRTIRAKTGTLASVAALSGYVLRAPRSTLSFAILLNGVAGKLDEARRRIDAVVDALARA